jgi:hypothetical protein
MNTFNNSNFNDRKNAAASAKAALIEKLRSRPAPDDPVVLAKQAERKAIHEARQQRMAEREALRLEQEKREAEERAAQAAVVAAAAAERDRQLEAERAAAEEARLQRAAKIIADEATRKAARDARYAARKARR